MPESKPATHVALTIENYNKVLGIIGKCAWEIADPAMQVLRTQGLPLSIAQQEPKPEESPTEPT